jgi:glycosyltransferase involved in cell wall biosynthesis
LRVAQICCTSDGAYWMIQIGAGLAARGYDVVAFIGGDGGDTAANCRRLGIRYVVMPPIGGLGVRPWAWKLTGRWPLGRLQRPLIRLSQVITITRLAVLLRRERIDVSHTHTFDSIIIGRLAAWLARVPVRVAMTPGPLHLESDYLRHIDVATHRLDHCLIGGSAAVDRLYSRAGVPASRRTCVPYGADPAERDPGSADGTRVRREFGIAPHTPLIGQIAYFYPVPEGPAMPPWLRGRGVKGHEVVVDAAALVLERYPDARFMLVGTGWGKLGDAHMLDIRRRCARRGIAHAVIFPGKRPDVADLLAAFDVSMQPSLSENYGGTVESLLMARPTIGSDTGGIPEVIVHERTGLLVPPGNATALAEAIVRLIDDPGLGERLGRAGREHIMPRWTTAECVAGVDRVYRSVALRRRLRRPPLDGC